MPGFNISLSKSSPRHQKLCKAIMDRYRMSQARMQEYHTVWKDAEDLFRAYVNTTTEDANREAEREAGLPQYTTIDIPQTYAMVMTAHTYLASVFLGRNPVFQFGARHGAPQTAVMSVEACLDYQVQVGEILPVLYIWILDPFKYGFGALGCYWDEEMVQVSSIREVPETYMGIPIPGTAKKKRIVERIPGYKGNRLYNIRPYDFFPDPRVPIALLQQGEFCGVTRSVAFNKLLRGAEVGRYINLDAVRRSAHVQRDSVGEGGVDMNIPGEEDATGGVTADENDVGFVSLIEMYIDLVPTEWGLGSSSSPEKWKFTLANEDVVIEARPAGEYHNKFPFFVQEYEPNGYELVGRGMVEIAKPLNDTLSWLINTHFHSIRKVLNDQLVVDPSRVFMKDVDDPEPGRIIRLKPSAYGTDPKTAVTQLQVVDVTQGHLRDAQLVMDMMGKVLGINESLMGQPTGGRKTATEVRTNTGASLNRMKTLAEFQSASAWGPLASVMLQNTQQYYTGSEKFRIAGDTLAGAEYVDVSPESIQGFFDFVPVDGTLPVDRFALANLWKEIMFGIVKIPQLMQQYDISKIFAHTAKLSGAKDIEQFKIQVRPDADVLADAASGKVVPLGGYDGRGNQGGQLAGPAGGSAVGNSGANEGMLERPAGPTQTPGVGPTA